MTGIELLETLSNNIKAFRKEKTLTQEKLAEEAELSSQAINAIEGKRRWPGEDTISKIASALDVEVYQLFVPQGRTPVIVEKTPENERLRQEIKSQVLDDVKSVLDRTIEKMRLK